MNRAWPIIGAAAAVAAGVAVFAALGPAVGPYGIFVAAMAGLGAAGVTLIVVAVALPAIAVSVSLRRSTNRSLRLVDTVHAGRPVSTAAFVGCFTDAAARDAAESYAATLRPDPTGRPEPTVAADRFFNAQSLIEVPLRFALFRHVPTVLFTLSAFVFLLGITVALQRYGEVVAEIDAAAALALLAGGLAGSVLAAALGTVAASVCLILLGLVAGITEERVDRLAVVVDLLFDRAGTVFTLRRVAETIREEAADLRLTLRMQAEDMVRHLDRTVERLLTARERQQGNLGDALADAVATAVRGSLEGPADRLAAAAAEAARERTTDVRTFLDQALATHREALARETTDQAAEAVRLLEESRALAREVRDGLADLADRLAAQPPAAGPRHPADDGAGFSEALLALRRELEDGQKPEKDPQE